MRWPIRNQILVPFAVIQCLAVVVVSSLLAWRSLRTAEEQATARLVDVLRTVEASSYPLTPPILRQLRMLSGAHFVLLDRAGNQVHSTLRVDADLFDSLSIPSATDRSIEKLPLVMIDGRSYFAGEVSRRVSESIERVLVLYPESQWREARTQALLLPVVWGGVVLLLTLLTSWWIARRISRRVQALQRHVGRISTGDFTPVPHMALNDELRDLSQSVNQMAGTLERSMQQIRETERAAMLTQLASGLAHHLRNALTGARVSLQLHQRHCRDSEDGAVPVALTQLERTEEQIQALLRVSQGKVAGARPARLAAMIDDVVTLFAPLCDHRRVDFEFECDGVDGLVSDAEAMRGALLNLLTNGLEAAGPRGQVRLSVVRMADEVVIRVEDNGPGVPEEMVQQIFVPFFTTKEEGVGIGLPVARRAAEEQGGTLELTREGAMTVFTLTIPLPDDEELASAEQERREPSVTIERGTNG